MKPTFVFEYFGDHRRTDMVVFVHGLVGDVVTTWGEFPALLASDPDLPQLDILLCGYQSRLLRWDPDITRVGKRLQSELEVQLRGSGHRIFLVGHSMGGLVILSCLVEACKDGHAQHCPVANVAWITLYASPTLGSEIANAYKYLLSFLHLIPARLFAAFFATRQVKEMAQGKFVHDLNFGVMQRLYSRPVELADANAKRFVDVRVVIGDEDAIVSESSARGLFHRLTPLRVTGTHKTVKEPTHHDDSRYRALANDIEACLSDEFRSLCTQCLAADQYAQARFTTQWEHALGYHLQRVFGDDGDTPERRKSLAGATWLMAANHPTITPAQAFQAGLLQVTYSQQEHSP